MCTLSTAQKKKSLLHVSHFLCTSIVLTNTKAVIRTYMPHKINVPTLLGEYFLGGREMEVW